jgi:arginine/lysine/ornithine decarboxylase
MRALGRGYFQLDLPAMHATDNTFHPSGCLAEAQGLAAELYGAAHTRFLAGGSTQGIQAAVMACVGEGDTLLVPRNVHRSVFSGLVLSGARPRFLRPRIREDGGVLGPTVREIRAALDADDSIRAVLLPRPSYYGLAAELREIGLLCRGRGVLLIIDEAHGSHFRFLPAGAGPTPALDAPVDVVVQSPHKTLGALIGAAQLHLAHGSRLTPEDVAERLNVLQTTSPSTPVLASLDAVRRSMWRSGQELFADGVQRVRQLRARLNEIERIAVLGAFGNSVAGHVLDPFRLVVDVSRLGLTGFQAQLTLRERFRIEDEFCDSRNVVFVLGPSDSPQLWDDLVEGFAAMAEEASDIEPAVSRTRAIRFPEPWVVRTPREAAFAPKTSVPLERARGRIAAELVTFYPPGIPVVCPGEAVTDDVLETCARMRSQGAEIHATDPDLHHLVVLKNS